MSPEFAEGPAEIAGVVGDVRERLEFDPPPTIYQMPDQIPDAAMRLLSRLNPAGIIVRARQGVSPESITAEVQRILLNRDRLPATNVRTMERAELDSTQRQNFSVLLLSLFAGVALSLAAVGVYGVVSYSVGQRTHEIGVRTALGAGRHDILKLVLLDSSHSAIPGIGLGLCAAFGLTRLLGSQLYGVKPLDPLTFVAAATIMAAVALIATYIPARRTTRVDPMTALRHDQ